MGPNVKVTPDDSGAAQSDAAVTGSLNGAKADRARALRSVRSVTPPAEARLNERLGRVLGQRRGPDAVMTGVLCAALLFGLIGLAAHFL